MLLFPATAFAATCDARFTIFFEFNFYYYVLVSSAISVALVLNLTSLCKKKCCIFQAIKIKEKVLSLFPFPSFLKNRFKKILSQTLYIMVISEDPLTLTRVAEQWSCQYLFLRLTCRSDAAEIQDQFMRIFLLT